MIFRKQILNKYSFKLFSSKVSIFEDPNINTSELHDYMMCQAKEEEEPIFFSDSIIETQVRTPENIEIYPSIQDRFVNPHKQETPLKNSDMFTIQDKDFDTNMYVLTNDQSKAAQKYQDTDSYLLHVKGTKFKSSRQNVAAFMNNMSSLAHGLEKVLNIEGIVEAKEIKSDPSISSSILEIPPENELNYDRMPTQRLPSQDTELLALAKKHNADITASTSTIGSLLFAMINLFSGFRNIEFPRKSIEFDSMSDQQMRNLLKPMDFRLKEVDGVTCIDKFSLSPNYFNILAELGLLLEYYFTFDTKEFNDHFRKKKHDRKHHKEIPYSQKYMKFANRFLLRSQIDCEYNKNGKVTSYEIKTRACAPIRYKNDVYFNQLDQDISKHFGQQNSWELEQYDLIRGIFPKWIQQMHIGDMEGAFIAQHNTEKLQGVEQIKLDKMVDFIQGSKAYQELLFELSLQSIAWLVDQVTHRHDVKRNMVICMQANQPQKLMSSLFVLEVPVEFEPMMKKIPDMKFSDAFMLQDQIENLIGRRPTVTKQNMFLNKFVNGIKVGRTWNQNPDLEQTFEWIVDRWGEVTNKQEVIALFHSTFYKNLFSPLMDQEQLNMTIEKERLQIP